MPALPMEINEIRRAFERAGFAFARRSARTCGTISPDGRAVTIVDLQRRRTIPRGTLRKLLRDASLSVTDFIALLIHLRRSDSDMGLQIVFVLTPDEDGGYVASAPGLPGCVTHGTTIGQAIANAREAATVYLDGATADSLAAAGASLDVMVVTVEVPVPRPGLIQDR